MRALFMCIGLALGNFGYQALRGDKNWEEAARSTWDQCVAVLLCYFLWSPK